MKAYVSDPVANRWSADYLTQVVSRANLVVLNDLGAESAGKEATSFTQDVLETIYDASQRVITTSNLSMPELRSTYHERLISRMQEGGARHIIHFLQLSDKRLGV